VREGRNCIVRGTGEAREFSHWRRWSNDFLIGVNCLEIAPILSRHLPIPLFANTAICGHIDWRGLHGDTPNHRQEQRRPTPSQRCVPMAVQNEIVCPSWTSSGKCGLRGIFRFSIISSNPRRGAVGISNPKVTNLQLALERCIQKAANHPVLQKDLDLKLLLEGDTPASYIYRRKAETAHGHGGSMVSIRQSIVGLRFYATDKVFSSILCASLPGSDQRYHWWFDQQKVYIEASATGGPAQTLCYCDPTASDPGLPLLKFAFASCVRTHRT
jgi:hypothetical protein